MTDDTTRPPQDFDAPIFAALGQAADAAIDAGLAFAYADDPHRFSTVAQEFDDGRAVRRLVLEYLAGGRVRVVLRLDGRKAGDLHTVELFSTTLQSNGGGDVGISH